MISIDPTRSGEQLFKSRLPLRTTDALISRVPPKFVDFLAEIPSSAEIEASQALVNQLEAHSTVVRQNRIETLKRHQERLASAAESHLNRLRLIHQRVNQLRSALIRRCDTLLSEMTVRTFAILEKRGEYEARRLREEERVIRRLFAESSATFELMLFVTHLEEESGGVVSVRRLDKNSPQFLRCRRATVENARKDYFTSAVPGGGRYKGMVVTNVFRVEHKAMLHKFQKLTAGSDSGRVKGLFLSLPPACLPRLIAFGVQSEEPSPADYGMVFRGTTAAAMFSESKRSPMPTVAPEFEGRGIWYERGGFAHARIERAVSPSFPTTFSRYSTLLCDKHLLDEPPGTILMGDDLQRAPYNVTKTGSGNFGDEYGESPDVDGDSNLRYLVLCRVFTDKVLVLPKEVEGFPLDDDPDSAYDAIYSQHCEEYKVLKPRHVLPEFIIQFKYVRDNGDALPTDAVPPRITPLPTPILPVDLSSATPQWSNPASLDVPDGSSLPAAPLNTLVTAPFLSLTERLPERPSADALQASLEAVDAREGKLSWTDLRVNIDKQRDVLMDAAESLLSSCWSLLPPLTKREGVLLGAVPSPTKRLLAGVPPDATVKDMEALITRTRAQLTLERAKRVELQETQRLRSTMA